MAVSERSKESESGNSLREFARDLATLVREELESAKAELAEKAKSAGIGAGMISASAITGVVALASLSALLTIALSLALPLWAAALVVTILWCGVTGVLILLGKRKIEAATPFVPEQTIENIKQDVAYARRDRGPR
ncbi:MAG: phage holin family protein [Candidatus Eremiobacteraeota bacterium]|nr:phage holin family protein [Candidatus Eremiobacteraeota bacterium]MBV8373043.1 phage holin family protein [Candidatus Eremiobacteraeota bacterium]